MPSLYLSLSFTSSLTLSVSHSHTLSLSLSLTLSVYSILCPFFSGKIRGKKVTPKQSASGFFLLRKKCLPASSILLEICQAMFFCRTSLPLVSTRWVRSAFSSVCPLSSNQRHLNKLRGYQAPIFYS